MNPTARPAPGGAVPPFPRAFWLACAMHFTGALAGGLQILFPLWIRDSGGTEVTIGAYAGIGGAAAVLVRLPVGRLLDTLGRIPVLAAAGLAHAIGWAGFLLVDGIGHSAIALVVLRGAASGTLFAAFFTYAVDVIPERRRAEGIAYFGIFGLLPDGLAPLLGEWLLAAGGYPWYFAAAVVLALVSLGISLGLPRVHDAGAAVRRAGGGFPEPESPAFSLRVILVPLAAMLCFGIAMGSLFTFMAPFAVSEGRGSVSEFFLAYAVSAVVVRAVAGRVPDRVGLRAILLPSLLLYGVGVVGAPHASTLSATVVAGAICGVGHAFIFPVLNVLALARVGPAGRGRTLTYTTAMLDAGATVAGPVLGVVAERAGYVPMFALAGAGVLVCALVLALSGGRR